QHTQIHFQNHEALGDRFVELSCNPPTFLVLQMEQTPRELVQSRCPLLDLSFKIVTALSQRLLRANLLTVEIRDKECHGYKHDEMNQFFGGKIQTQKRRNEVIIERQHGKQRRNQTRQQTSPPRTEHHST